MRRLNLFKRAGLLKKRMNIMKCFWVLVFLFCGNKIHAQGDIAGEMDFTQKTINKTENPGTANAFTDADFKLYPNPATNVVYIQSKVKLKEGVTLTICDIMGNILEKRILGTLVSKEDYSFNLNRFSNGQYIIGILSVDGSFVTKKLIKRG
jgi:hypothetical protein